MVVVTFPREGGTGVFVAVTVAGVVVVVVMVVGVGLAGRKEINPTP